MGYSDTSLDVARYYFEQWVMPRRVRDLFAETKFFAKFGFNQKIYRRVLPDDKDRGSPYPILTTGIRLLAHFGIGVAIYFSQLLILGIVLFLAGLGMIPLILYYKERSKSFENGWDSNNFSNSSSATYLSNAHFFSTTAACPAPITVTATQGCPNNSPTCEAIYRESACHITYKAAIVDVVVVLFIFVAIYVSKFFENTLKVEFDEAVQTAQDYSIMVADPNPDASDPDEWYKFFSRFGIVKYVTVTKKNGKLKDLLKKKHSILKELSKLNETNENVYKQNFGGYTNFDSADDQSECNTSRSAEKHYLYDIESPRSSMQRSQQHLQELKSKIKSFERIPNSYSDDEENSSDDESRVEPEIHVERGVNSNADGSNTMQPSSSFLQLKLFEKAESIRKLVNELNDVNQKLSMAFREDYEVNKVFVVFEYEEHQRLAIKEMEVPDIETLNASSAISKISFRSNNILEICEPPEPDNVLWSNTEVSDNERFFRKIFANSITISIFVGCFYAVRSVQKSDSAILLPILIGAIDSTLPIIFYYITNQESPTDEGKRQESLQVKLFGIRLLISSIFPYLNTPWNSFFDLDVIFQNFNVLIAACFTDPVMAFLGIPTLVTRYIVGPLFSSNQESLNAYWAGAKWSIAERYTNISKILFISLFYSIFTPVNLFLAMSAFILLFFIDRFLLLRRWEQPVMMDETVAERLRQQVVLAVTVHLFVTLRFIYSWPMDSAYYDKSSGAYVYVNKEPEWNIFFYEDKFWQSKEQQNIVYLYKILTIIMIAFTFYIWFGEATIKTILRFLTKQVNFVGDCMYIAFSHIERIPVYIPLVTIDNDKYIFADISLALPRHMPALKRVKDGETQNLSDYVPKNCLNCLATVKYYGDASEMADSAGKKTGAVLSTIDDSKNTIKKEKLMRTSTLKYKSAADEEIGDKIPKEEVAKSNDAEDPDSFVIEQKLTETQRIHRYLKKYRQSTDHHEKNTHAATGDAAGDSLDVQVKTSISSIPKLKLGADKFSGVASVSNKISTFISKLVTSAPRRQKVAVVPYYQEETALPSTDASQSHSDLYFSLDNVGNNDSDGQFTVSLKSDSNISNITFYNKDVVELIPEYLSDTQIRLMKNINREFLRQDKFDPTSILDSMEDLLNFQRFYDRLACLSPAALQITSEKKKKSKSNEKVADDSDASNPGGMKVKMRQLYLQLIYIQKELVISRSNVKDHMNRQEFEVMQHIIDRMISWKLFLSVLMCISTIEQ